MTNTLTSGYVRRLTCLCLLLPGLAVSEPSCDAPGRRLVDNFVNDIQTLSARFEQTLVDADDTVVETSGGTMSIKRPGKFRWTYSEPYEQILVADGLNVWNHDVELEQVTVKPQAELLGSTPALLLGGAADVLDDFEFDGSFEDRGIVWVRLRPIDTDSGFTRVELGFDDGTLRRMIFFDSLEQSTLIGLFDVVVNEPIDDTQFEFDVPANADLVGTPLEMEKAES
ncbi:MAG: outer membrane lipoprotein chaperone LolA [Woeseiaceae bacterium]|nr:outer membrane lipoprotein chaperone LolA [Woeseiaceae bacterium]